MKPLKKIRETDAGQIKEPDLRFPADMKTPQKL